MKTIIFFSLLALSLPSFAGLHLSCKTEVGGDEFGFLSGEMTADCEDENGSKYYVTYSGYGLGLKGSKDNFHVNCPAVSQEKLEKKKSMTFGGLSASVAAFGGVDGAVVVNKRLGVCVLAGVEIGLGAQVSAGKVTIGTGTLAER